MGFKLKGLKEQRGQIQKRLSNLGQRISTEQRAMTADEQAEFQKLKQEFLAVQDAIRVAQETLDGIDGLMSQPPAEGDSRSGLRHLPDYDGRPQPRDRSRHMRDRRLAYGGWARAQYGHGLTPDQHSACVRLGIDPRKRELCIRLNPQPQTRAMGTSTSSPGGGYLIEEEYSSELERALVANSGVRDVCRVVRTETGADLPWPKEDDTSNTGEQLGEATEVAYADPEISSITFDAYKFSSKGVLVNAELMQDAAFDLEAVIFESLGERIGRIQGQRFTTGTGSSQPKGVVTCASAGVTTAGANAITAAELTRLAFSVDPAYRNSGSGSVGYMMKDDTLAYLLTLADANGNPLLRESFRDGGAGFTLMLNGFPVFVNQHMTGLTNNLPVTATKHVLFGDFKNFIVRDAGDVRLRRLDERWAEKDQVGFIGFLRSDSNCVNTAAIKYLLQS